MSAAVWYVFFSWGTRRDGGGPGHARSDLKDDQRDVLIGVTVMFLCLCSLAITLRVALKRVRKSRFELDDYFCFAAFVS